jgi:SAM-dependent methyltransferase
MEFKKLSLKKNNRFIPLWKNKFPRLYEKTEQTDFDRHYIFHPAWASRIVANLKPKVHVDISSTLSFCSIVSAFIPVDFYDYRPANLNLSGLKSRKGDLMALPFRNDSVESISCMHTVEHVGLGRYGDPIDPDGDIKAINELKRVTSRGGTLLFVTPIGKPKIMFNAHRIYSYEQIISYFEGFELKEFSLIPDDADKKGILTNPTKEFVDKQNYGCGCFWFIKK